MSINGTKYSNSDGSNISDDGEGSDSSWHSESDKSIESAHHDVHDTITDRFSIEVREWAEKVPIGLGLCPWAIKSKSKGLLRVVTCESNVMDEAVKILREEIQSLTTCCEGTPSLSTTLVVCPHIKEWEDFHVRFSNLFVGAVDTPLWQGIDNPLDASKMLSMDDFMYVLDTVLDAPINIQFPELTFLHKDSYL